MLLSKMTRLIGFAGWVVIALQTQQAHAALIGGVEFPDGAASFADSVVSYSQGTNVGTGWDDPSVALGIPDYSGSGSAVSLGVGGVLTLQFTDNSLTTSGDASLDLWIFEVGNVVEWFNVGISTDGSSWIDLGDVLGQPTGIDIDPIAGVTLGTLYSYIRLTDIDPAQTGSPFSEADIDAVGAISSGAAVPNPGGTVPAPATLALFGLGLAGLGWSRRKKS